MATMTIDLNDAVEVQAAGLRALSDALGDDGARVFINQYNNGYKRPRLAVSQIAAALERGNARAATLCASTANNPGRDFTRDRHDLPELSNDEIISGMREIQEAATV